MSNEVQHEIDALISSLKSVQLATLNAEHQANISYAPYLKRGEAFYIFISELASHTQNLKLNPKLSLMFIEDEVKSKTVFARQRLILECNSHVITKDEKQWEVILAELENAQGPTIKLLKSLPDFCLFQLTPEKGSFVKGFGQAFKLSGEQLTNIAQVK